MFNTKYANLSFFSSFTRFWSSSFCFCKAFSFSAINWSWITDLRCTSLAFFKGFLVTGIFAESLTLWIASIVEINEIEIRWQKQNKPQSNLWMWVQKIKVRAIQISQNFFFWSRIQTLTAVTNGNLDLSII